ncbi:MAG: hypothetical protein ABW321_29310 [Polyangiales bacterium]
MSERVRPPAYEPPILSDYLVVRLSVREAEQAAFERGMGACLCFWEGEATIGWRLLFAAKAVSAHVEPEREAPAREYLHVWQTPSPMNLWQAMFKVASRSDYAALHKLVLREEQDIMRFASQYAPSEVVPQKPLIALQEVDLVQDWFAVQTWQAGLAKLAREGHAGPASWELALALQSQTGRLRRHLQVWSFGRDDATPPDRAAWERVEARRPADRALRLNEPGDGEPAVLRRSNFTVYTVLDYRSID